MANIMEEFRNETGIEQSQAIRVSTKALLDATPVVELDNTLVVEYDGEEETLPPGTYEYDGQCGTPPVEFVTVSGTDGIITIKDDIEVMITYSNSHILNEFVDLCEQTRPETYSKIPPKKFDGKIKRQYVGKNKSVKRRFKVKRKGR